MYIVTVQVTSLTTQLEDMIISNNELREEVGVLKTANNGLKVEVNELETQNSGLQMENAQLKAENQQMKVSWYIAYFKIHYKDWCFINGCYFSSYGYKIMFIMITLVYCWYVKVFGWVITPVFRFHTSLYATVFHKSILYVIVKALPRVCMKNTARGECRVVNTAQGKAECCIYHETLPSAVFHTHKHR